MQADCKPAKQHEPCIQHFTLQQPTAGPAGAMQLPERRKLHSVNVMHLTCSCGNVMKRVRECRHLPV